MSSSNSLELKNLDLIRCKDAGLCFDASCVYSHPTTRMAKCLRGNECRVESCHLLHDASELEKLIKSQQHSIPGFTLMTLVKRCRLVHNQKLLTVNKERSELELELQRTSLTDTERRNLFVDIISVKVIALIELVMQRNAFDNVVLPLLQFILPSLREESTPETLKRAKAAKYQLYRELYRLKGALPALALRGKIEDALRESHYLVLQGSTGSGKSTQLPAYLADMDLFR